MTEKMVLEKLMEIRREKGFTQKALAKKLGIQSGLLSMLERGKTLMSMRRFLQICEALEIFPAEVFDKEKVVKDQNFLEIMCKKLAPNDVELLVWMAQMLWDRNNLRR